MGEVRQMSGADAAAKNSKEAAARAAAAQEKQLELAQQEFEYQKQAAEEEKTYSRGIAAEDRATASADYNRRLGIGQDMLNAATFSPEFYDQQTGEAAATTRDTFDKQREAELRSLGRYGITPGSGRFQDMSAKFATGEAAAEATAANTTRQNLGAQERQGQNAARAALMSVTPQYVGEGSANPTVGLQDPSIGIYGQIAGENNAQSTGYAQQANSALGGFYGAIGSLAGTAIGAAAGGPAGAAVGSQIGSAMTYNTGAGMPPYATSVPYQYPTPSYGTGSYAS